MARAHRDETARLQVLKDLQILDTLPEKAFDDLCLLATQICKMPMATISLIDRERQWFKSKVGVTLCETSRDIAFCDHTIREDKILMIPDALKDKRFSKNPLVLKEPHIRFYAGAPLINSQGIALGALCVMDSQPQSLSHEQEHALIVLARQVMTQIELRETSQKLSQIINERQKFEEVLRRTQDQLVDAIESLDAGLVMFDAEERLVICNKKYREIYSEVGKGSFDPNPGDKFIDILRAACKNGIHEAAECSAKEWTEKRLASHQTPGKTFEQKLKNRWIRISDLSTSSGGVVSLHSDITLLKQSQDELRHAKDAAEKANRAKSDFLANMSHELRTPLNAILGYVQILRKDHNFTSHQIKSLNVIESSAQHLLGLINGVLDFSKIEAGRMDLHIADFNLSGLLTIVRDIISVRAHDKGLSFKYEEISELPIAVRGDETKIRQILINVLGNAVKFTNEGSVTLKVGKHEEKIRFEVEDTGMGIPTESLQEIFLPFQQASRSGRIEGTGLGLAISRRMANMMGAELYVESVPDQGSRFWFDLDLPSTEGILPQTKSELSEIIGFSGATKRILIVDEVKENRGVLHDILSPLGFTVQEAEGGKQCLAMIPKFKPHLILMDLRMPEMDGFETTRQARNLAAGKNCIIIAVSAGVSQNMKEESLQSGCNEFLAKPFRERDLLEIIGKHLKLTWLFQQAPESGMKPQEHGEIHPPSFYDIAFLMELAMKGDVMGIRNRLDELESIHTKFKPFVEKVRKLSETFQMEKIRKYLKSFLEKKVS